MGSIKFLMVAITLFIFTGCTATLRGSSAGSGIYEEGYRKGVTENIEDYVHGFEGGDFPYFNWAGPIVQYVDIPAQIGNGVFIPEHREPVLIKPGEWKSAFSYPIKSKDRRGYENNEAIIRYYDANVADLTIMPKQFRSEPRDDIEQGEEGADNQ